MFCRTYQISCKHICIENLTIKENTFDRRQGGTDEEIDFLFIFDQAMLVFHHFSVQLIFNCIETLVNGISF